MIFSPRPRVLCIAGMHRSGTSMTASWLAQCGVTLDFGGLFGAGVGNERGHFEDMEIAAVHHYLVDRLRPGSEGWKVTDREPIAWDAKATRKMAAAVKARRELPLWGWKDPRATLFLDDIVAHVPRVTVLALWRPRAAVIDSLVRRAARATDKPEYAVDADLAGRLWDHYNDVLLDAADRLGKRLILASSDTVVAEPRLVFDALDARLGRRLTWMPIESVFAADELRADAVGPENPREVALAARSIGGR